MGSQVALAVPGDGAPNSALDPRDALLAALGAMGAGKSRLRKVMCAYILLCALVLMYAGSKLLICLLALTPC